MVLPRIKGITLSVTEKMWKQRLFRGFGSETPYVGYASEECGRFNISSISNTR
jgi:hypothetical protein